MRLRIKNTSLTIKILGGIQIIGGIYGIGVVSWLTMNLGDVNGAILFIAITGYALFSFSIYVGIKMLNSETRKLGLILSIINQCLQIFQFKIIGYGLTYIAGTALSIGFKEGVNMNFSIISSQFSMSLNTDDTDFVFMVNLLAIFIIVVLFDIWEELYNQEEDELESVELAKEIEMEECDH